VSGRPGSGRSWRPPNARTCELSIAARDQSMRSASLSLANSSSWSRCQTPASCHSRRRRQQVIPEPQPISCGRYSHGIPVCNTNKIPVNTFRSSIRLRPGNRCRRGTFGISGSINSHNGSDTNGLAIVAILSHEVDDTRFVSEPRVPAFR
jgi:hypothetical protein